MKPTSKDTVQITSIIIKDIIVAIIPLPKPSHDINKGIRIAITIFTKNTFNKPALPPKNFIAKYNGNDEIIITKNNPNKVEAVYVPNGLSITILFY